MAQPGGSQERRALLQELGRADRQLAAVLGAARLRTLRAVAGATRSLERGARSERCQQIPV